MTGLVKLEFEYGNASFWCREMTVGDYYVFLRDPEYLIQHKLTEGGRRPQLSETEMTQFLHLLMGSKHDIYTSLKKKTPQTNDFHLQIGRMMRALQCDVMGMPLALFWDLRDDFEVLTGKEKYDPDRKKKTIDSVGLQGMFGRKKSL